MVGGKNPSEKQILDWKARPAPRRRSEVPSDVVNALSRGWIESKNLVEWLVVDRRKLLATLVDELGLSLERADRTWLLSLEGLSALKTSHEVGRWLSERIRLGDASYQAMVNHSSDVVREWSAIVVGVAPDVPFHRRLAWIKTHADDNNAGTRELAWIALRSFIVEDPAACIERLIPWTGSRNERLRRFASEVTRPCGVWCAHVPLLKKSPELGIPILEPLCSDASKYVSNSVGNWLNDASKSQPHWVRSLANHWRKNSPTPETDRILRRALRTIGA